MASRLTKFSAYTGVYVVIVIAGLAVVNFLAQRHNKSVDTTSSKKYSLSDQTQKVVGNLANEIKVTYFDKTERFPGAKDLLDRYANLSTKLKVEYIDPYKNPQVAKAMGVRAEGTIFVQNGPKQEEARALTEEELTGAVIRSLKSGERMVCAVSGSGEKSLEEMSSDGLSNAKQAMERINYKTKTIKLLEKAEVPGDCTILLVAGPRRNYLEPMVKAMADFVDKGGDAIFLLGPALTGGKEDTEDNKAVLELLAGWGIQLGNDVVVDESGIGAMLGLNEFVPLVVNYEGHAVVREMRRMATAFPLARSVEPKAGGKATAEKLFTSAEASYATKTTDLNKLRANPPKDTKGPIGLAAAVTVPGADAKQQARIVVVGSSEWVTNSILSFNGNRDLFLNMINWLSADEDLISIRPKELEDRRLEVKPSAAWMLYVTSFLPAFGILIAGFMVWLRRR